TGEVEDAGIPMDKWAMGHLQRPEVRQALRLRLVSDQSLSHGLYDATKLTQAAIAEFALRHGLRWRKTATGMLSTSNAWFERLGQNLPEFASIGEVEKSLKLLREFKLSVGADGRCRTPIWAFSTVTSRMGPAGSSYPFTTAAWTRYLIMPGPGTALI